MVTLSTLDPSWQTPTDGSSWVSFENSVCIGCSVTTPAYNAQQAALGYSFVNSGTTVNFTQDFTLPAGYQVVGGSLNLLTDDAAGVSVINSANPGMGVYIGPSGGAPHFCNCPIQGLAIVPIMIDGSVLAGYLEVGVNNTLEFTVTQGLGESSYGLDYNLNLTLAPVPVPEPASASLIVLAGMGLVWLKRHGRAR